MARGLRIEIHLTVLDWTVLDWTVLCCMPVCQSVSVWLMGSAVVLERDVMGWDGMEWDARTLIGADRPALALALAGHLEQCKL